MPRKKVTIDPKKRRGKDIRSKIAFSNGAGRPSTIDEQGPKIIKLIREGNVYSTACACFRVSYMTFCGWMRQGKEDLEAGLDTKFSKFLNDVREAEALNEAEMIALWKMGTIKDWKGAQSYLSRRNPTEWATKDSLDITSGGEKIKTPIFLPLKDDS